MTEISTGALDAAPEEWRTYDEFAAGIDTYRLPGADLSGETVAIALTDGPTIHLDFRDATTVSWTADGVFAAGSATGSATEDPYDAVAVRDDVIYLNIPFASRSASNTLLESMDSTSAAMKGAPLWSDMPTGCTRAAGRIIAFGPRRPAPRAGRGASPALARHPADRFESGGLRDLRQGLAVHLDLLRESLARHTVAYAQVLDYERGVDQDSPVVLGLLRRGQLIRRPVDEDVAVRPAAVRVQQGNVELLDAALLLHAAVQPESLVEHVEATFLPAGEVVTPGDHQDTVGHADSFRFFGPARLVGPVRPTLSKPGHPMQGCAGAF
jgi:hypothetical protein